MGSRIGYARVSTIDQNPQLQIDALEDAGCSRIFTDRASGTKVDRPELAQCLDYLRDGDSLIVWKLERLGRSLPHLIELVGTLNARDVEFVSVKDNIDTSTATGRLIFHLMASLAEFERDLIRERTLAGLAVAKEKGRLGGRPPKMTDAKLAAAKEMKEHGELSMAEIAEALEINRTTLYRHLAKAERT